MSGVARKRRNLYCCGCGSDVQARLTNGREVYPHRRDLAKDLRWKCDGCGNSVGCHKPTDRPLGCIPDKPMKQARMHIHSLLDPLWKSGQAKRGHLYARLTDVLGREYHTGELRTLDEARTIYRAVQAIKNELSEQVSA